MSYDIQQVGIKIIIGIARMRGNAVPPKYVETISSAIINNSSNG